MVYHGGMTNTTCDNCDRVIEMGFVDYSDTPGYVHVHNDEALCDPEAEDSPDATPMRLI